MISAASPSSSDPPEIDREVKVVGEATGVVRDSEVDVLQKGIPSWASKVKDKRVLRKYEVDIVLKDGKNKVEFPEDILSETTPLWEEFVVGKFLDLAPHIAKVHMVVNKIWSYGDSSSKVEVYDVDAKTMRFKITSMKAREKVIRRGMWNIAGVPMVVKKWTPKAEEETPEEEAIPMWVHLRKIPLHTFSWEALSFMTSTVGFPVRLHPETIACSNFEEAKVFVKVDVSKHLPKEIDFMMGGKEFTVEFYYPWLPSRCAQCEKWGHTETVCSMKKRDYKTGEKEAKSVVANESGKKIEKEVAEVQILDASPVKEDQVMGLELKAGTDSVLEDDGSATVRKEGNDWLTVSGDKVGRVQTPLRDAGEVLISASKYSVLSVDEVEEGEIAETLEVEEEESMDVEAMDILEGELLEDEILCQHTKEKDKAAMQKGSRRGQKTKAQEAQPKSKRSSRRKL